MSRGLGDVYKRQMWPFIRAELKRRLVAAGFESVALDAIPDDDRDTAVARLPSRPQSSEIGRARTVVRRTLGVSGSRDPAIGIVRNQPAERIHQGEACRLLPLDQANERDRAPGIGLYWRAIATL